ncbi:MAG: chemotaxis protein CheA [Opitutaceae bacterium]|nr:chemotaxis protein CheA [Opitutaceae bacterium]
MPIPTSSFAAIEDTLNRLAGESILAQVGRDDGLIPSYSLLSELIESTAGDPVLQQEVTRVRGLLDVLLDTAKPFSESALAGLKRFVEWLPGALAAAQSGAAVVLPGQSSGAAAPAAASPAAGSGVSEPVSEGPRFDQVMDLNLDENRELLLEFHAEALDHLAHIESSLLILDGEPENRDALNQIFRSFHTIKGVSGFLHLTPMHTLTHEVESLLDLARNGKLRLNPTIITAVLQSRDAVQVMVGQITLALEQGQLPSTIVPVDHLIRTVKLLAVNPQAEKVPEPSPSPAAPEPVAAPVPESVVVPLPVAAVPPPTAAAAAPVEVPANVIPFESGANAKPAEKAAEKKAAASSELKGSGSSSTVRVNTDKLDAMMDVVGELVIVQSQIAESARLMGDDNSHLARNIAQLGRITKELQHNAMSVRLVPIKPTFQKMERLVRDLARDCEKKVNFHTSGEDTEIDRTVIEEIADPLVHMVRNSMDHGLEKPAVRLANGKPEHGNVTLKAFHQGSNIHIELSDDGRGIDRERIYAKAVEKGVIPAGAQMSRDEVLALIFAPGFSTAEKVTSVSGRGVGMDVVRRNIEKLRGKVEIDTEVGKGTIFRIKLPLTMAIIDGLVVRVGSDRFILPSTSVQMALRPAAGAITTVHGRGEVLDHRGRILPIHRLNRRFQIPGAIEDPLEGIIVLVETSGRLTALLVDEMVSKQEVVIKNLGGLLSNLPGIAGGAILGDGNIALILDPTSLFAA